MNDSHNIWIRELDRPEYNQQRLYTHCITLLKQGEFNAVGTETIVIITTSRLESTHIEVYKTQETEAVGYIGKASILAVGPTAQHNYKTPKGIYRKAKE